LVYARVSWLTSAHSIAIAQKIEFVGWSLIAECWSFVGMADLHLFVLFAEWSGV